MEPFEPFESTQPSSTSKPTTQPSNTVSKKQDWSSDWSNSFETDSAKTIKPLAADSKLPATSSYNWNKNASLMDDKTKNEEDLFSSLVKDVSISAVFKLLLKFL